MPAAEQRVSDADESSTAPEAPPTDVISRRRLLLGLTAGVVLAACGSGGSSGAARTTSTTGRSRTSDRAGTPAATGGCTLTPELTAGPYYLNAPAARRDITEGRPGIPLELRIRLLDAASCKPLAGAAVDVWHCDAGGEYSGFEGNSLAATNAGGTNGQRYLRGVQLTDADGVAVFTTIFPGWYEGRSVHIHLSVHAGGAAAKTYEGGHVAHTGQVFFEEPLTSKVMAVDPYRARTGTRTTNAQDSIYAQAGRSAIAAVTTDDRAGRLARGLTAEITCNVDPDATPPPAPLF